MPSKQHIASPKQLLSRGKTLQSTGHDRAAVNVYLKAASALVGAGETDSRTLAEIYLALVFVYYERASDTKRRSRNMRKAVDWYEKAIEVYSARDNARELSGNLTNMSALLFQAGQLDRAVEIAKDGLDIAETLDDPCGHHRLAAWNHYAGYCLRAGKLDEAETTLKRGLSILGEKVHAAGFLMDTLADVYEAKTAQLRKRSAKLLANHNRCGI